MRWVGHVERMGEVDMYTEFCWDNLREKNLLEDQVVGGRVI
jgi:hypothetical protein